ncbi:EcsC family protein [Litoribacter ruber]|uniref:EcsC family protein n=1 Tax=Litoribacter ruber TaxID=702568 RepID=A0AAP2CKQ5_9BACT|nr:MULTISPECIES: EcsC family protein [Litoribacter]MBS9525041.1 EcsC family protein [Litoribacter alkaliphilus]MBT0811738.1 EcsC family protein [Litoribacter ruber]
MDYYEKEIYGDMLYWERKITRKPSIIGSLPKAVQNKINNWLPEKFHQAITAIVEKMVKGIQLGTSMFTSSLEPNTPLAIREKLVSDKIKFYKKTAAVEGGITGAGGIIMGFVDFPAFLGIKFRMLMEIGSLYGYHVSDFRERLFLLHVFQLAFCTHAKRLEVLNLIKNWEKYSHKLPSKIEDFDWKTFQLEYRDYLDLAKLAQLIPVIGAGVGVVVNYRLVNHLGETAMNCYRLRYFSQKEAQNL